MPEYILSAPEKTDHVKEEERIPLPPPNWTRLFLDLNNGVVVIRQTMKYDDPTRTDPYCVVVEMPDTLLPVLAAANPDIKHAKLIPLGYDLLGDLTGLNVKKAA